MFSHDWLIVQLASMLCRFKIFELLTQCASKRDHLRNVKIANFQNLFRGTWGCWENLLRPKNFGPGRTGRPVRPILSAIFGYFSNFALQKNHIKCSVLTTFLPLDGQLGTQEYTKGKSDCVCHVWREGLRSHYKKRTMKSTQWF